MSKKLLVVDSSSVAVTLFYALGGAKYLTEDEYEIEEILEFIDTVCVATLDNIERKVKIDDYQAVRLAMDPPEWAPSWRYKVFADYKHSQSQPNKPRIATNLQRGLIAQAEVRGVPTLFSPGYEADDVIGTMVAKSTEWVATGGTVHIWSQDKDLHQLVSENVIMLGKAGTTTELKDVLEAWGVTPNGIPLVKALVGDPSDNIPGIKGLGAKTVQKFIREAPHRKPSPYWLEIPKIPEKLHRELLHLLPRILRDEDICLISKSAPLYPGERYDDLTLKSY